jgi:uncharacterized cupin superfamily protein
MPQTIIDFGRADGAPVLSAPEPERVLDGEPRWRSWIYFSEAEMSSGLWESSPGRWTIAYDKWEFLHVLEGAGLVRGEDGTVIELKPGASAIIRPGFRGTWEVHETMRKQFFVRRLAP